MKEQLLPLNSPPINLISLSMQDNSIQFVVIDDDSINNMVCKAAIKSATGGKIAVCFNKPAEGLKYFEENYLTANNYHPTILFLDLNMPEMSGWEWLEKYRSFADD